MRPLVLSTLLLMLVGCGPVGAIAYKILPPETTKAKFKLGQEPTVVLVENSRSPGENEVDARQIMALLRLDLIEHKSAVLVPEYAVLRLKDADPAKFAKMSITEIGRQVDAKQVVYVDIIRTNIEVDYGGQMVKGSIETTCRVIDVRTGMNRWPIEVPQGIPVGFETPQTQITERMTESDVRRRLHDQVVLTVGRFFRDWVSETDHLQQ